MPAALKSSKTSTTGKQDRPILVQRHQRFALVDVLRFDMFWLKTDPDPSADHGAEDRQQRTNGEPQIPRGREGPTGSDAAAEQKGVSRRLESLRFASGRFATPLNGGQALFAERATLQRRREDVRAGHGVLDREIDPDAADGRHGVGRIADEQQAGFVPLGQTIELNGEQLHLTPVV